MGPIKEILAETQFQEELTSSSQTKLVIVDFTASWCGPCQTIAPFYEQLSRKYPNAVFLKVDVDKCQETAVNQRVSVMPTFHFYRNKVKVDSMQGADRQKLEEMIQKYYDDGTAEDVGVSGHPKKTGSPPKKDKDKNKKNQDASQDPGLAASRMGSTHHMVNENRGGFKEGAKKFFGHGRKSKTPESGGNRKTSGSPSNDDGSPKTYRRSFKDVVDNIFHPHHNKGRGEKDPQNPEAKSEKKTSKDSRSSQIAKEQKKKKRKEDKL